MPSDPERGVHFQMGAGFVRVPENDTHIGQEKRSSEIREGPRPPLSDVNPDRTW